MSCAATTTQVLMRIPLIANITRRLTHTPSTTSSSSFVLRSRSSCATTTTSTAVTHTPWTQSHRRSLSSLPPHTVLGMPALSPTMTSGSIAAWKVSVGTSVAPGDVLAEVETDKATIEWESVDEFVVAKLLVSDGVRDVKVGAPVMVVTENESDVGAFDSFTPSATDDGSPGQDKGQQHEEEQLPPQKEEKDSEQKINMAAAAATAAPPVTPTVTQSASPTGERVFASPLARRAAAERSANLSSIVGSGPGGRVVLADVLEAPHATTKAAPGAGGGGVDGDARDVSSDAAFEDVPLTGIRRIIASRLLESKQTVPHYYLSADVRVDALMELRARVNAALASAGAAEKLSLNDYVIKASAIALRRVPAVNAAWMGEFIREFKEPHIGVAVQTDYGLVVPVVKAAGSRSVRTISGDVRKLAGKARARQLAPDEMEGGTFTISNLGMYGSVTSFAAIINPPQAAILAVGCTREIMVPTKAGDGMSEKASFVNVTLSCDHRVVDGAVGAEWLKAFKDVVESPEILLVD